MHPGGHEVGTLNHADAMAQTHTLLAQDQVTIYEAAIQLGDLFIRVHVLRKSDNQIELIEVKAKSFNSDDPYTFCGKRGGIDREMLPYLQDADFQRNVVALA